MPDVVRIEGPLGAASTEIPIDCIDEVTLLRSCFWSKLTIYMVDGTRHSIGGLAEGKAASVRDAILEEAIKIAGHWGQRLKGLAGLLSGALYIRYSKSSDIHKELVDAVRQRGKLVRERLDHRANKTLVRVDSLKSSEVFEKERKRLNEIYVTSSVPSVKAVAGTDLTYEQAETIATDEDVTLVLAGAGTGKTKVIVGKVAHLIRNKGVDPSDILVLAFNNKVEKEIKKRLSDYSDLSETRVFTFNAFGYDVIGKSQAEKPPVSKLAEDAKTLRKTIDDILRGLLDDPQQSQAVVNFILNHRNPSRSAYDFDTVAEYKQYIRSIELRTLSGDLVKSNEELTIANFLTMNGIEFSYEGPFKVPQCTIRERPRGSRAGFCNDCPRMALPTSPQHRQYQPDFFLPDYDIYIEHFALDEKERPPHNWTDDDKYKYVQGVKWKRTVHEKYGTTLLETYSWQSRRDTLVQTLQTNLEAMGVECKPLQIESLIEKLGEERISWLSGILVTFLNHVRGGDLRPDELRQQAITVKDLDRRRDMAFLDVFKQVRTRYEQQLNDNKEIDFHDQINMGADYISQGKWESPYRYIIVDEFQDISKGRMKLLQVLKRRNVAYFLVGDDWQSIYRFTGSDVGLLFGCNNHLGYVQERMLSYAFRFKNGILEPSTTFIKRNREQSQRSLRTASSMEDQGITIISDESDKGLHWAFKKIEAIAKGKSHSVLVLARYNRTLQALPKGKLNTSFNSLSMDFSTVHAAKGREADYVVVLDLKDDRWGFPSKVEDDPLLDIVLPPVSSKSYPFAEERRLFYVAMTRARIGAYLVADASRPSGFVEELQLHPSVAKIGELAERCPECSVGFLVKISGSRDAFMGCTEYGAEPSCRYTKNIEAKRDDKLEAVSDDQFWDRLLGPCSR